MLRVAVCDDEIETRTLLQGYVLRLVHEYIDAADILFFESADKLLAHYPAELDILLLDIMMNGVSGMDAAKKIREFDDRVKIVFITNMPQFALEGYSVKAYGYLIKPVHFEDFRMEMQTLIAGIMDSKGREILVKTRGTSFLLSVKDINYVESLNAKVIIHTVQGSVAQNAALTNIEKRLSPHGFLRCHNAFLVNATKVVKINGYELQLRDNTRIPISKNKRSECVKILSRYMRGI